MTDLSLLFLVFVWGLNYSIVKEALNHFSPLTFNGIRFLIASLVIFILFKGYNRTFPSFRKDWGKVIVVGLLGNTFYQILFILGVSWTLAGNTSLILATTPVFVALFAVMLEKEKVSPRMWGGIFASLFGVGLVVIGSHSAIGLGKGTLRGDLTVFLAGIVWSIYIVASAPLVRKYGAMATTAATLWTGAFFLFLCSIPSLLHQNWSIITGRDWGALFYSAILSIALAQVLWYRAIGERGNARTSAYSNLIPLVGLLVAWPMLGETPQFLQIIGGAAIIAGLFLTGFHGGIEELTSL